MAHCLIGFGQSWVDVIMYYLSKVNSTWKWSLERVLLVEEKVDPEPMPDCAPENWVMEGSTVDDANRDPTLD